MAARMIWKVRGGYRLSEPERIWISYCPLLEIRSQGRTEQEARAALEDAVKLFLVTCLQRGILPDVLQKLGLKVSGEPAEIAEAKIPEEFIVVEPLENEFDFEVPLYLVAAEKARQGTDWRR